MRKIAFLLCCFSAFFSEARDYKPKYFTVAINNYVTAKPIIGMPKLFYSQWHPGITVSTGFDWKTKEKSSLNQSFKLGYMHHRYVQNSILLYTEIGKRFKPNDKLGLSIAIGGGYLHMIPGDEQFRKNNNGDWQKIKLKARPQVMLSLSLGVDYKITTSGIRAFIRYQNMLQTPFVPGYVPLLPYNVLHVGASFPINIFKNQSK